MLHKRTEIILNGSLTGHIWWPIAREAFLDIEVNVTRESHRMVSPTKLVDVLDHILTERGGDFQDAQFSGDSLLIVRHIRTDGPKVSTRERYVLLVDLPSLSALVKADAIAPSMFD